MKKSLFITSVALFSFLFLKCTSLTVSLEITCNSPCTEYSPVYQIRCKLFSHYEIDTPVSTVMKTGHKKRDKGAAWQR